VLGMVVPFDVSSLAERAGMTERTFHRKFAAATGETSARFVEIARLDAARMLLSRGRSLKSVAAEVGLFPPVRLTGAFERRFGIAPRLFRYITASSDRQLSKPASLAYPLTIAWRSAWGAIASTSTNPSGARASTVSMTRSGPPLRLDTTIFSVAGLRSAS